MSRAPARLPTLEVWKWLACALALLTPGSFIVLPAIWAVRRLTSLGARSAAR